MNKKFVILLISILFTFCFVSFNCGPKPNQSDNKSSIDPFPKEMLNHKIFKVFRGENRLGYTFRNESKQVFGTKFWQGQEATSPGTDQIVNYNKNQALGLSTRLPTIGSVNADYKNAEKFKIILKGLKIHELKQPALLDEYTENESAKKTEFIISMLSAEKIVIQIEDKKGVNLGVDTGIASVFSNKLNYSKELEGMIAAENVFIGYITVLPNEQDIKRKASKSVHHKSSDGELLQLAIHTPKNKTGDNKYNWLGNSMNDKIEMAFQRIPKFYVVTSRKEDARYHVNGSYKKIGSRFEIDLNLTDSFRNNEQLLKYNNAIKIDTIDELYEYQISAVNAFVKPLGITIKEEEKKVIKIAIKTTKSINLVKLYNEASLLFRKGKYNKAFFLLKTILSQDSNYIDANNRMGIVLNEMAKYSLAIEYFKKVSNIGTNKNDKLWIAISFNNIGLAYKRLCKYQLAFDYYLKALKIYKEILNPKHPKIAIIHNNIGSVYSSQGKYQLALNCYNDALKIYKEVLSKNHLNTAKTYNNIGLLYKEQEKYQLAINYFIKSLKMKEKILDKEHPEIAVAYNNIGLIYENQKRYQLALDYYLESLKIYEKILGKNHPKTATTYNNIGIVYYRYGNYDLTLDYYFKALDVYDKIISKDDPKKASTYNNIGAVYYKQKKYKKALKFFLKSVKIWKKKLGNKHKHTKDTYYWLSLVYGKLGDKKNEEKYDELSK